MTIFKIVAIAVIIFVASLVALRIVMRTVMANLRAMDEDKSPHPAMADPVRGQIEVTGMTPCSNDSIFEMGTLTGMVSASGVPARAVQLKQAFRTSKWPRIGQVLPATLDRANPNLFAIEWAEVATATDAAT